MILHDLLLFSRTKRESGFISLSSLCSRSCSPVVFLQFREISVCFHIPTNAPKRGGLLPVIEPPGTHFRDFCLRTVFHSLIGCLSL